MSDDSSSEYSGDSPSEDELVLAEAVAIVDHSHQLLKKESQLRRLGRALQCLGITGITGGSWTHLDEEEAEIVFNPIRTDRFIMLIAHLEDLADLIKDQKRVSAPVTVRGVHIHHVEQLQILFDTQPPTTPHTNYNQPREKRSRCRNTAPISCPETKPPRTSRSRPCSTT